MITESDAERRPFTADGDPDQAYPVPPDRGRAAPPTGNPDWPTRPEGDGLPGTKKGDPDASPLPSPSGPIRPGDPDNPFPVMPDAPPEPAGNPDWDIMRKKKA
jgi:hypothetical protein